MYIAVCQPSMACSSGNIKKMENSEVAVWKNADMQTETTVQSNESHQIPQWSLLWQAFTLKCTACM